jgi:hypothetical protein
VSVGTVTAQLLYEIASPAYLGPDVTARFDTSRLEQVGDDRVAITGTRGSAPPATLKVALNDVGGFRNTMPLVLTGLELEAKAARAEEMLFEVLGGRDRFAEVDVWLLRFDRPDAPTNEQATAHLRVTVKDPDPRKVGRSFSNATMELALAGYAGFHTTNPPTAESTYGIYRPAAVPRTSVTQTVVLPDGRAARRRRALLHTCASPDAVQPLLAHLTALSVDVALLSDFLQALAGAGAENARLAQAARAVWPTVARHVLGLAAGDRHPFCDRTWGSWALGALLPQP